MKKLFYFGLIGIAIYEFLKVYFIMPMPKSQELNYLNLAYFLHIYRWAIRAVLAICILLGLKSVFSVPKWYQKADDTHASGVYQAVFIAYFAKAFCENTALRFFEQYLEASKAKAFAGETSSESIGKSG